MQPIFIFWGKVISGKKRGNSLGFPTANVRLHKKIPEGIYAASVCVNKKKYQAAVFIGSAKTFEEKDYKAEAYVFDFNKNIYDSWISVYLYKKIRENEKFTSEKKLIEHMEEDVKKVREYFRK